MGEGDQATGPLAGLKVLDVASLSAGPMLATLPGDYGANVIEAERHCPGGRLSDGRELAEKGYGCDQ